MLLLSRQLFTWTLYIILLIVRVLIAPFLPGYIHPDEFFQGGQELWFGDNSPCTTVKSNIPWEFQPQYALRSVIPPLTMTWIPLRLYSWMVTKSMENLSGMEVLVVPRLACALVSILLVDGTVWKLRRPSDSADNDQPSASTEGVPLPVLILASSWPTVVMLTRPFSNTMETFCLAALLQIVMVQQCFVHNNPLEYASKEQSNWTFAFAIKVGIICAVGLFTRFTFVFFAAPVLIFLFYRMVTTNSQKGHSIIRLWKPLLWMTISFAVMSLLIVMIDTSYYNHKASQSPDDIFMSLSTTSQQHVSLTLRRFVLTPLNAFRYNSQVSNLKEHGLHPRWTHCLVNMFILYGPLTLVAYISMMLRSASWGSTSSSSSSSQQQQPATMTNIINSHGLEKQPTFQHSLNDVSQAVILFGLAVLSVAPHQEPRFLLPLLTPLILVKSTTTLGGTSIWKYFITLWIMFNMTILSLFGVVHQAGVVHSLLGIGQSESITLVDDQNQSLYIIYWRTYMPPTFLTRTGGSENTCTQDIRVVDLNGSSLSTLLDTIEEELQCSGKQLGLSQQVASTRLHLVVPYLTNIDNSNNNSFSFQGERQLCTMPDTLLYDCKFVAAYGPHLTTEDFPSLDYSSPSWYDYFMLGVYEVSCKNK
jgi:GPI mannosyltransferase 4